MKFPYHRYLKYLICLGHDAEMIVSMIMESGYSAPSSDYIENMLNTMTEFKAVRTELDGILAKQKMNQKDVKAVERIMNIYGVAPLFRYFYGYSEPAEKAVMTECVLILQDMHVREIVEAMLLRGVDPADISEDFIATGMIDLRPDAIERYGYFFWDTVELDVVHWKEYLNSLGEDREKFIRLNALYSDTEALKWKMGLRTNKEPADMARDMVQGLYFRCKDMLKSENVDTVAKAARVATAAVRIMVEANMLSKAPAEEMREALQLKLGFKENRHPVLDTANPEYPTLLPNEAPDAKDKTSVK